MLENHFIPLKLITCIFRSYTAFTLSRVGSTVLESLDVDILSQWLRSTESLGICSSITNSANQLRSSKTAQLRLHCLFDRRARSVLKQVLVLHHFSRYTRKYVLDALYFGNRHVLAERPGTVRVLLAMSTAVSIHHSRSTSSCCQG